MRYIYAMKINNIQNFSKINQTRTATNSISRKINYDVFEPSFEGKRIKHSKDFLEITKNDKDLRQFITKTCMLDENKVFSQKREKAFCLAYNLLSKETEDKRNALIASAIAIKSSFEIIGDYSEIETLFKFNMKLLEEGFSKKEVCMIFNPESFDFKKPAGFIYMKELFKDSCSFEDMNFFLTRYGLDKNAKSIDTNRIVELALLFNLINPNNVFQADGLFSLTLDKDGNFDAKRSSFLYGSTKILLERCRISDKNSAHFITSQENKAKGMILSMLTNLINSNTLPSGEFDEKSAKEAFKIWLDYIDSHKEEINGALKVPVYFSSDNEVKEITINEAMKVSAQNIIYDSDLYRIAAVVGDIGSDILQ